MHVHSRLSIYGTAAIEKARTSLNQGFVRNTVRHFSVLQSWDCYKGWDITAGSVGAREQTKSSLEEVIATIGELRLRLFFLGIGH
jgi:hypothetical protein